MILGEDTSFDRWSTPQCPFSIEYSPAVMEEIRLAVMNAYHSAPRGGVEIGGLLLGRAGPERVVINGYLPMECEHAFGPSFSLSVNDRAKLEQLLAEARDQNLETVGWYHSHHRTGIHLSEADQELHDCYFPGALHVAMVLKPQTAHPSRAGFFFREADGSMQTASSYQEIPLISGPQPSAEAEATAPVSEPPPPPSVLEAGVGEPPTPVYELRGEQEQEEKAEVAAGPGEADDEIPRFLSVEPEQPPRRRRNWVKTAALFLLTGAVFALPGYWLGAGRAGEKAPSVALRSMDQNGQLLIAWDANAPAVRTASDAVLTIEDGPKALVIPLDTAHLRAGNFTYARKGPKVDVALAIASTNGQTVRDLTSFAGGMPPEAPAAGDRGQLETLKADLAKERARALKLEQQNQYLSKQLDQALQRKRTQR